MCSGDGDGSNSSSGDSDVWQKIVTVHITITITITLPHVTHRIPAKIFTIACNPNPITPNPSTTPNPQRKLLDSPITSTLPYPTLPLPFLFPSLTLTLPFPPCFAVLTLTSAAVRPKIDHPLPHNV